MYSGPSIPWFLFILLRGTKTIATSTTIGTAHGSVRRAQAGGSECLRMDTGHLYTISSSASGISLRMKDDSTDVSARLVQSTKNKNFGGDLWRLWLSGTNGYYRIINEYSRLDLRVYSRSNGASINQNEVSTKSNGNWCFQDVGTGYYKIVNEDSGLFLSVFGTDVTLDGARIMQNPFFGNPQQKWLLSQVGPIPDVGVPPPVDGCKSMDTSSLYTITAQHSSKALHVVDDSVEARAAVIQKSIGGTAVSYKWRLQKASVDGYYNVYNENSGLALAVNSDFAGRGAIQEPILTGTRFMWCFRDTLDGSFTIVGGHSGLVLDVVGGKEENGAEVDQWRYYGAIHQQWILTKEGDKPPTISNGRWQGIYKLPLVPAAAANLPDGRILTWSAAQKYGYGGGTGKTFTSIFDPNTGTATDNLIEDTDHDMFCPGTVMLPDTTIMITGGKANKATTIYEPLTNKWKKGSDLIIGRGYHAMTVLSNGNVLSLGGSWSGARGDKHGEIWDAITGKWTLKPDIPSNGSLLTDEEPYRGDNHYWLFTAPNDMVFHAGPARQMHWIDTKYSGGKGRIINSIARGDDDHAMNGCAVMFDIGKILTVGGAVTYSGRDKASSRGYVIDINGGLGGVTVHRTKNMNARRTFVSSVVLPSGEVVVVGGMPTSRIFSDLDAVMFAEIWNPKKDEFTKLASMKVPRTYHSTALLLKDGRVFVGGGGLCGEGCDVNHDDAEIFIPPYLLNSDDTMKERRPTIKKAPGWVNVGTTMRIEMGGSTIDDDYSFVFMRIGASTHSVNNDIRRIPLSSSYKGGGSYDVKVPNNPGIALPGMYYLFALDSIGVPSISITMVIPVPT